MPDTVQRLYDSQFHDHDVHDISQYIRPGQAGRVVRVYSSGFVLLIDEIDKADLEFPNDLLWELDQMEFFIPETRETVKAKQRPIILITSNAEKELPDAFLRRCVFHYIKLPDEEMMERIVHVHVPQLDKRLLDLAIQAFYWLRDVPGLQKKPSTSELIDWVQALARGGVDPKENRRTPALHGRVAQEGPRRRHRQPGARERPAALTGTGPAVDAVIDLEGLFWQELAKGRPRQDLRARRAAHPAGRVRGRIRGARLVHGRARRPGP